MTTIYYTVTPEGLGIVPINFPLTDDKKASFNSFIGIKKLIHEDIEGFQYIMNFFDGSSICYLYGKHESIEKLNLALTGYDGKYKSSVMMIFSQISSK